jgi:CRP-like cAMP-binding protein
MSLNPTILKQMELFAGLDTDARTDVIRYAHARRVPEGSVIFQQGQPATTCHALVSGRARISQSGADRKRVTMRYVGPGDLFGAMGIFAGGNYLADAVAVSDCVVVEWTAAQLTDLILRFPRIGLNALAMVGRRLHDVQQRLQESATDTAERRLARSLAGLARQAGRQTDDGIEISFPLSRRDLAEIAGATHFTASRALSGWTRRGIVRGRRGRILVRDLQALQALADDPSPADCSDT